MMTDFERGIDAAMNDLLEMGRDTVVSIADESAKSIKGLKSKFSQGYRRFAYYHMNRIVS